MRAQQLARHVPFLLPLHAHEGDREIARYAVHPEARGPAPVGGQILRRGAERVIQIQQAVGQTLEEVRLVLGDPQVVELDLGVHPREGPLSLEGPGLPVLFRHLQGVVPRTGHQGREHDARGPARRNRQPVP